jgi:hypothetical protein
MSGRNIVYLKNTLQFNELIVSDIPENILLGSANGANEQFKYSAGVAVNVGFRTFVH